MYTVYRIVASNTIQQGIIHFYFTTLPNSTSSVPITYHIYNIYTHITRIHLLRIIIIIAKVPNVCRRPCRRHHRHPYKNKNEKNKYSQKKNDTYRGGKKKYKENKQTHHIHTHILLLQITIIYNTSTSIFIQQYETLYIHIIH